MAVCREEEGGAALAIARAMEANALDKTREGLLDELLDLKKRNGTDLDLETGSRQGQIQQQLERVQPGQGNTLR